MLQQVIEPDLSHIPGPSAPLLVGHTLALVRDPFGLHERMTARYGPVYRLKTLGRWNVTLAGVEAVEMILTDREANFSSKLGWYAIERLFSGGLMLRDFDDHRAHRRVMQVAFRAPAMRDYLARMNAEIGVALSAWPAGEVLAFYAAIKELTLQVGANVFMGLALGSEAERLNQSFVDEVAASTAVIRRPLPFTAMQRGVEGRAHLSETFRGLIAERRTSSADDLFSHLCRAEEDGKGWSDEEIVDHFNFLMMAAHDTTTSALTTMTWALATYPEWQEAVRAEVLALGDGPLAYEALGEMSVTERVFKEALRFMPPVPFIPRVAVKAFTWQGLEIPAGSPVVVNPGLVMRSPELWSDPESYDPDRFSSNRAEDARHRFAWAPFGGGAHKCIGLHFAYMQVKAFVAQFLRDFRIEPGSDEPTRWQRIPIPKPKDGLPVRLTRLT